MSTNIDKIRAKAFFIYPLEELMSKNSNSKIKPFYKNKIKELLDEIRDIMDENDVFIDDILDYEKTTYIEKNIILKYF